MGEAIFKGDIGKVHTTGGYSPGLVQGDFVVNSSGSDSPKTDISYLKVKESWVTSNRARVVALISTTVSAVCALVTLLIPIPLWDTASKASVNSFFQGAVATTQTVEERWFPMTLTVVSALLSASLVRYWLRRHKNLPEVSRYPLFWKSLVPQKGAPGQFSRAKVEAQCIECTIDNRPEEYGPLKTVGKGKQKHTVFICRYGHRTRFRERSLFIHGTDRAMTE